MNPGASGEGAGAQLKAAREQQGLDLGVLAAQLKVPVARLEALETGNWSALPDGPYARGLAKAVCRVLQIDAGPLLRAMPGTESNALERVSSGLNQPFREDGAVSTWPKWLGVAIVCTAAVFAALIWWSPIADWQPWRADPQVVVPIGQAVPEGADSRTEVRMAPATSASAPSAALPASTASVVTPVPRPETDQAGGTSSTLSAGASVPAQGPERAAPSDGALRIVAQQATWLSVIDGRGQSLTSRLVPAGETVLLDPVAPVRLTIGNAPGVRLEWRGQSQDLSAFAQVRVARLELR